MKEYITPTYIHTQEKDRVSEMGDRERPIDVESQRECMRHRDRQKAGKIESESERDLQRKKAKR